jgi:hypothetical protein
MLLGHAADNRRVAAFTVPYQFLIDLCPFEIRMAAKIAPGEVTAQIWIEQSSMVELYGLVGKTVTAEVKSLVEAATAVIERLTGQRGAKGSGAVFPATTQVEVG